MDSYATPLDPDPVRQTGEEKIRKEDATPRVNSSNQGRRQDCFKEGVSGF